MFAQHKTSVRGPKGMYARGGAATVTIAVWTINQFATRAIGSGPRDLGTGDKGSFNREHTGG